MTFSEARQPSCYEIKSSNRFSFFSSFQLSLFPSVLVFLCQVSYLSHNHVFLDFYFLLL